MTTGAGQVVVVQALPEVGPLAVQLSTGALVVLFVPQVVAVQLLPAAAATGVQEATPVGPVVAGAGQVVAVQLLPEVAADGVQDATGTLVVLLVEQVVVVQAFPRWRSRPSRSTSARWSSPAGCR